MVILHAFGARIGLPDASPFVLKVDAYLRMAAIEFETRPGLSNLRQAPKGKLPFITHKGEKIADSQFIIAYLKTEFGDRLDEKLTDKERALAYLLTKSLDENLYFVLLFSRWIDEQSWPAVKQAFFAKLPTPLRLIVPLIARKKVRVALQKQGLLRHSRKEILLIAKQSLEALSDLLGDSAFVFGESPSSLDATLYGFLAEFILSNLDNDFNQLAKSYPRLVAYCQRIKTAYYLN